MTQILIIGYTSLVILSGNVAATDLGITSEIKMITTVKTAHAIPTLIPQRKAIIVTSVGNKIFATLFPIRIVVINSLGFSSNFTMPFAFLSPLSASVLNFVLLAAVNAVSLPEKKNEININIIMAMITRVVSLLSYLIFIVVT